MTSVNRAGYGCRSPFVLVLVLVARRDEEGGRSRRAEERRRRGSEEQRKKRKEERTKEQQSRGPARSSGKCKGGEMKDCRRSGQDIKMSKTRKGTTSARNSRSAQG